jgi:general secretion pathway protein D
MRLSRRPVVSAAFTLVCTASAAFAQDKPAEPAKPKDEKGHVVRLIPKEGGWPILELFDQVHKMTGISILYDQANATFKQAKVEFIGEHLIAEDDLFDWLQAVLSYRKLVLVPVGPKSPGSNLQQWFVMDQADPNLKSRPVYIDENKIEDYADRDGLYVVTTLTLHHITDAQRVRNALSPLSTQTAGIGRITDLPGSRALIVGDFAPVVAAMKRLLVYIDVENVNIEPRMDLVELKYEVASELEPILTDLIQANEQGRPQQPRQPGMPEEEPEPKIIANNRLDALIIYATDGPMKKIKDLIARLDVASTARSHMHFRALRHTDAEDMAKLLDDLISSTSGGGGSSFVPSSTRGGSRTSGTGARRTNVATGNTGVQGGAFSSAVEGAPVIIPDPKSNSLIIQASPSQWETIDELITKLDQSRPQVLIETSLIELSLTNELDLGVELLSSASGVAVDTDGDGVADAITNDTKSVGVTSFNLSNPVNTIIGTGDNAVSVMTNRNPIIGTGFTAGIFKNGRLPLLLRAAESSGRARILTQPSLVTNDNEQATLTLEKQTSYRQTVRDSTNTSTDSFQQITAKTELSISPHISSDNYLRLDIQQTVSDFVPGTDIGGRPPDQTTRTVDTHVTLPDQYTVVLGGLIQENESTKVSKVPLLGDIPVLGFFFRSTSDASNPSHLFLFVTPHILRDVASFADYHKLTWERKLLQDDLFKQEVFLPATKFAGPDMKQAGGARARLRQIEESGALDSGVLKAPPSDEERRKMAEDAAKRLRQPASPSPAPTEPQKK